MRIGGAAGVNSRAATPSTATIARTIQRNRGVVRRKIIRKAVSMNARTTNNIATMAAKTTAVGASDIEVSCAIGASAMAIPQKTVDSTTVKSALRVAPSIANTAVITSAAYGIR